MKIGVNNMLLPQTFFQVRPPVLADRRIASPSRFTQREWHIVHEVFALLAYNPVQLSGQDVKYHSTVRHRTLLL
jgi:hypothetical protein